MILAFEFKYLSQNDIFAYLLRTQAQKSGLDFAITKVENLITLFVKASQDELANFANELSKALPHSIFLADSRVYSSSHMPDDELVPSLQEPLPNITPEQIASFSSSAVMGANAFNVLSEFKFNDTKITSDNFSEILAKAKELIVSGKRLCLKRENGSELFLEMLDFNSDFSYILPTNLKNIPKICIANEHALAMLASFEKPLISLRSSAIFRASHSKLGGYFKFRAAWDGFIYALCASLLSEGVGFLGAFESGELFEALALKDKGHLVVSGTQFLPKFEKELISSSDDKNATLFSLASYRFSRQMQDNKPNLIRIFCSLNVPDVFELVLKNGKSAPLLFVPLPASLEELYSDIGALAGGDRLLQNYAKERPLLQADLNYKNGFYGLICIAGLLLGLGEKDPGARLLELASDFNGAKGVRIEFKMADKLNLDVPRVLRSLLSFILAGAGEKNIAYGLLESMAYFLDEFSQIAADEHDASFAIAQGELFANPALCSASLTHTNLKFSQEVPLESGI